MAMLVLQFRLEINFIAPEIRAAVLQPKDAGSCVRWNVLTIGHHDRFTFMQKDFDMVVGVAERLVVQAALDASIRDFSTNF